MNTRSLLSAALDECPLSPEGALHLLNMQSSDDLARLRETADEIRARQCGNEVAYQTGASLFLTNLCEMAPRIYPYPRKPGDNGAYILTIDAIDATVELAAARQLRQFSISGGGFWPSLEIPGMERATLLKTYAKVLSYLRERLPNVHLIGFSPDELEFLRIISDRSTAYLLDLLKDHGLQTLGGYGAEILVDRVRQNISPRKASVKRWFDIVREAYQREIPVIARLEGGHFESQQDRVAHLQHFKKFLEKHPGAFSQFSPSLLVSKAQKLAVENALATLQAAIPQATKGQKRSSIETAPLPEAIASTTLADRQKLLAVSRLLIGKVLPQQEVFRIRDHANEAQEELLWGASSMGATDAEAYTQFLNGDTAYSEFFGNDLERLVQEVGRKAVLR